LLSLALVQSVVDPGLDADEEAPTLDRPAIGYVQETRHQSRNDRDPVSYAPFTQDFGVVPYPDFGRAYDPARVTTAFRVPRQVRLGARFEW
jgi:hypothetical protein